jgi:hypothetical protein
VTVRVTLPLRLVSEANARGHWSKGARRAADQRGTVRVRLNGEVRAWLFQFVPGARFELRNEVRLIVTITRIAPRELDGDNLQRSCKAVRDGIADALGVDDRSPRVEWNYAQRKGGKGEYAVEIHIDPK